MLYRDRMGESVIMMMMGERGVFWGPGLGEGRMYIHIPQITTTYY